MDIGSRIKDVRKKKHLSQIELSELLGTTQSALAAIESNKRIPKLETLSRIASALDVSILDLLPKELTFDTIAPATPEERQIYDILQTLNADGQRKVKEYASDLAGNALYQLASDRKHPIDK